MKGIVFREFGELVTARFGEATWDALINESKVASGGAYTAVGTYPHEEAVGLLMALSRKTGVAPDDLLRAFGEHLFGILAQRFPFASLAEGLLRGAITHWGGRYTLARRALGSDGSCEAIFELGRT